MMLNVSEMQINECKVGLVIRYQNMQPWSFRQIQADN